MNDVVEKNLQLLGHKATDKISGVSGIITSVSFDLFGCIQATLNRGVDKDGKPFDAYWFDVARLNITSKTRVMGVPDFVRDDKGPADKPQGKMV